MGFFDRLAAKKNNPEKPTAPQPTPEASASVPESAPTAAPAANAGRILAQLKEAREKLDTQDIDGAIAIYEELLRTAGDRADVLVTLSGDLGVTGHAEKIVELLAPHYDAERHGPAAGLNLLQAYIATRHIEPAQHLLHILFSLGRPELEERLHGFSNALGELIEARSRGLLPPPGAAMPLGSSMIAPRTNSVNLVSISKPIWAYGLENIPGVLPQKNDRVRRLAFAQTSVLRMPGAEEKMKQPEDELGRFTRGFPLMLAECFYYSPNYAPIAALGTMNKEHYVIFSGEWTPENLRQLSETASVPLDYVFTSALQIDGDRNELTVKVWEVKKMKERKAFTIRYTVESAQAEFAKLFDTVRMFMEWSAYPAGTTLDYTPPTDISAWCDTLGTSLSLFLGDKGVLPKEYVENPTAALERLAPRAATSERAALAYLTAIDRAQRMGAVIPALIDDSIFGSPVVAEAKQFLNI
ncbi:MAG TPA: hypothetical protein VIM69_06285 [Opitutaceae bacterium]